MQLFIFKLMFCVYGLPHTATCPKLTLSGLLESLHAIQLAKFFILKRGKKHLICGVRKHVLTWFI